MNAGTLRLANAEVKWPSKQCQEHPHGSRSPATSEEEESIHGGAEEDELTDGSASLDSGPLMESTRLDDEEDTESRPGETTIVITTPGNPLPPFPSRHS